MSVARASLKRRAVVLFLCALVAIAGVAAYFRIGKLEDPSFTIKTAVVTIVYPGSTAYEVEREATSRVEDAVQAMGEIKRLRSRSVPGMAIVYVDIKDKYTSKDLPEIWDVLRQKLNDVQVSMPAGSAIMVDNDFGDVYGQYYALVGDGYTMKELWDYADFLKKQLVLVPGVASVKILGEQKEAVYVEFSATRLSSLGLAPNAIFNVLNQQNTLSALGTTTLGDRFVRVSPTGAIMSVDDIGDLVIGGVGGQLIRLREVATVRRDFVDPQSFMMRFNGRPALGIGIATVTGGNVVTMGESVSKRLRELEVHRPIGMELNEIYMQSDQVTRSVQDFIVNLIESLAIVVGVLLVFMGMRTGLIIGAVLLLTVAGTFVFMNACGVFLQIVSLGALIIALGSLVDNAIVVSESMLVGVERGMDIEDAADQAVEGSKWAMLGGTFIAVLAFVPIGLSQDSTGEFCRSLLQVVGISMMLSWGAALTVTPVFGQIMLKPSKQKDDPYDRPLFRAYRALLEGCLRHRFLSMALAAALFWCWGPDAAGLLYGSAEAGFYLQVLAPVLPLLYLESMVDGAMKGVGEQKAAFRYSVWDAVLRLAGVAVLLPRYGMRGFLAVMLLSTLYTCAANTGRLLLSSGMPHAFRRWLGAPALAGALAAAAGTGLRQALALPLAGAFWPRLAALGAGGCATAGVFLLAAWPLGLGGELKRVRG